MRPVLAVASTALREVARRRGTLVFLLVLVGSAVALPRAAPDVAGMRAKLQVAASYGIGFPLFLIALHTIAAASAAISLDLAARRIQTVATKPCAPWQIVLGKLLAVVAVNATFLLVVLIAFAFNALSFLGDEVASPEERETAMEAFFTPRLGTSPRIPAVDAEELRRYVETLRETSEAEGGAVPRGIEARARRFLECLRLRPGGVGRLSFDGIGPDRSTLGRREDRPGEGPVGTLILRYALHWSPPGGAPQADCAWEVRAGEGEDAVSPVLFRARERVSRDVPHELFIPGSVVPSSGSLSLSLRNPALPEDERTLIADPREVEILVPYGSFWPGVLRAFALLLLELTLLAVLCLGGSAVFTFPTAVLLGLFVYLIGMASGFLHETLLIETASAPRSFLESLVAPFSRIGMRILEVLPDAAGVRTIERLTLGRALPTSEFLEEGGWALLQTGAVIVLASVLLSLRELAGGSRE